ncbi:MAG: FAD-binding oxidoreductase [Planctomycetaceae bacterium]|nr:FAD-binding oxidoreductase [Planctomycetaceae bacterium]
MMHAASPMSQELDRSRPENTTGEQQSGSADSGGVWVNDAQSLLNRTRVQRVDRPRSVDELVQCVRMAARTGRVISVSGGRHALGGQQFAQDAIHLDLTGLDRVVELDAERGQVTVEAGIMWPALIDQLHARQPGRPDCWTIREKQTGVDEVTIGGSLSANIHGRGLTHPPFVTDIEAFDLVDARGTLVHCSRRENPELFSLAIGGYGLFGVIARVTLRLVRRFKVCRRVVIQPVRGLLPLIEDRTGSGFLFGDCQYSIDLTCQAEEHPGVSACYEPVAIETPLTPEAVELSREDWARLYRLIRVDKPRAFEEYADHYQRTDGQVYWSDTHQLAGNFAGHRAAVQASQGTEMITEAYVRRDDLIDFLARVRQDFLRESADVSYGTIRFIERDEETFLPWARDRYACVICNLHVRHSPEGRAEAAGHFRRILDTVVEFGGSFYLTYHRWATRDHVAACHPHIGDFLRLKRAYDPAGLFQSEWYRHYAPQFGE